MSDGRDVFSNLAVALLLIALFRWSENRSKSAASIRDGLGFLLSLGLAGWLYLVFFDAPEEATMGIVQKIFYLHVPSANAMYLGWVTAGVGSLMYLIKRDEKWDALAVAGTEVGMLFWFVVMITGPLWGRSSWGTFWVWDPRLTSTLLAGMVFLAYLSLRGSGAGVTEKRFGAALAVIGFPLMFLIKYSVQVWAGQHPRVLGSGGGISDEMKPALYAGLIVIYLLSIWLLWVRFAVERSTQRTEALTLEALDRGLLPD